MTDPTKPDDTRDWRVPLWDAVNDYAEAGRAVYGNTRRQLAVVQVERAVKDAVLRGKLDVLNEIKRRFETSVSSDVWLHMRQLRQDLLEQLAAVERDGKAALNQEPGK